MIWNYFIYFAIISLLCWLCGAWMAWKDRKALAGAATVAGLAMFGTYIIIMWVMLERPPMRTMGETRLWYSFFLPLAGLMVYSRFQYKWLLSFSTLMAAVFIGINLFKPEIHSKTLMPALQSPWFAPHVAVYMLAYAILGAAFLIACVRLWRGPKDNNEMAIADNLVSVGWALLTVGIVFGALWAKEAWGTYWAWDPKETWAAATWLAYLVYIHYRLDKRSRERVALWMVIIPFVLLQITWWGINYLPSAQGTSVHTYNMR